MTASLAHLRDQPFELLAALEDRIEASGERHGLTAAQAEWTGLGFTLDGDRFLAPQADVREVLEVPLLARVPGARTWLLGLANVRGDLVPVVDLGALLGRGQTPRRPTNRMILLNDDQLTAGFLVESVAGFRRFAPADQRHELADHARDQDARPFLLGAFVREGMAWLVLSLRAVAADPSFRDAGM